MNEVTFTIDQLLLVPRPPQYLDELAACAISRSDEAMIFDRDSDCYRDLKARYAHYRPTQEDHDRVIAYQRSKLEGKVASDELDILLAAYRADCLGCSGRSIAR